MRSNPRKGGGVGAIATDGRNKIGASRRSIHASAELSPWMIQSANHIGKNATGLRYGAPCALRIDGRNDGGPVFQLAPPDRQGVSDAARKVCWVRRREFGGWVQTNGQNVY